MRNATSSLLFGASSLVLTVIACGGSGGGSRDDNNAGMSNPTAGSSNPTAGSSNPTAGSGTSGNASGGSGGSSAAACNPMAGPKSGDGKNLVIDDIDDTDTMFAPAGTGTGAWDFSKDAAKPGTITPDGTAALMPEAGGQMGSALHVTGTGLLGWGAALGAFLNGAASSFDASSYKGVAFYIKGTSTVQEGANKVMVQARMPDVLPGTAATGSCCDDKVIGKECYSGHRITIDLTAEWSEVKIAWADFKGPTWGLGSTMALDPNRIRDITFSFNHDSAMATGDGTSFDVWIDGVRFMSMEETSNVKPGGSGGSGGGGNGGSGGGGGSGGSAEGGADQ